MATPDQIHKEIDLIQDVIKRMASNSFEVKKWLIGLLTIILVFKNDELLGGNLQLMWLLLIPVLCFCYLDAFFLSTEKRYREMYKWIIAHRSTTDKYLFDLNTLEREYPIGNITKLKKTENNIWNVVRSKTIWPFYLIPTIFIVLYGLLHTLNCFSHSCSCH